MNILVIEDDPLLRKALSHQLIESGHSVSAAANGQDAIVSIAKKRDIEVIICDVMMPVLTGPGFLLMLKKYFPHGLPSIIVISGVKEGESFLKKIDTSYDYFVPKPINFEHLKGIITDLEAKKENSPGSAT